MILKKYFKYNFLFFRDNNKDTVIIKKGFKISIGWNLGRKKISNHLFDHFISIPIKATKNSVKKVITNNIKEILIKIFWFKKEKKNKIIIPKEI